MASYYRDENLDALPRIAQQHGLMDSHLRSSLRRLDDPLNERWLHNRSAPAPTTTLHSPSPPLGGPSSHSTHKLVHDLHDQVKFFKSELEKKDRLISELTSAESPRIRRSYDDTTKIDTLYEAELRRSKDAAYRLAAESSRSELAGLQLKCDRLQSETRELESRLAAKELTIQELRSENVALKESETRQAALIASFRERLHKLESETGSLETVQTRGEITIATLQRDNREQQSRIVELESLVRSMQTERDEASRSARITEARITELNLEICKALGLEGHSPVGFAAKVNELVQENLILKGKLTTLTDHLGSAELESKASRETIMRLVSEISREQKSVSSTVLSIESMRAERDAAVIRKNELEREVQILRDRIDANQKAWNTTRQELEHRDNRASTMVHELKTHQYNAQVAETTLRAFKESLASLLSDGGSLCDDSEEAIKERVRLLHMRTHERHGQVDSLENKVKSLNEHLDSQVSLHQAAIRRAKEAEDELEHLKIKFCGLEGDLASTSLLRDSLRTDKERRMASIMKMDQMALDVGYDMTGDALMSRAEQLVRLESDAVADKTTTVYNLQRKIKNLKEQLESKDLHLELLRKKIHNLEEGLHGRSGLQKDRDDLEYSYKRSRKENERLRGLLGTARETIKDLKSQLLDTSNLKLLTLHQREKIDVLESDMDKLERTREKQARKITGIKQELEFTEHEKSEERGRLATTLAQVENELRATRQLLEETSRRERQLVDFRQVIARMLGLDVNSLAVPDYEVIARLEKVIQAHHSHTLTSHTLQQSMSDTDIGLGYGAGTRRSRARSLSPSRRRHIHTTKF
ncbi:coiled-coil domain-containing protein 170-like isoform X2 [Ptychodera flava]|uniref:coiled-coil domain-containing protein 170-like isoform X2 n=1 Tax=Ptychodera flava TaxID=63121 RepID=UPI00396A33C2